jgi:hypothetical protein
MEARLLAPVGDPAETVYFIRAGLSDVRARVKLRLHFE